MAREMDFIDECYADKDLSLLKILTLVIPTYNRNYYLSRCLWYHAHFPFGQIIVADSSPEEKKVVNRETVAKIREMFGANILYLEYEPETEKYGGDIYRKWGDAVMHVETEYSVINSDKEFVIPNTLIKCLSYLLENSSYISASGQRIEIQKNIFGLAYGHRSTRDTFNARNPISRLKIATDYKYNNENLYGVYSSRIHKSIYSNLLRYDINDIRYGEVALELQPYVIGNIKKFNDIQRIRDVYHLHKGALQISDKKESSALRYKNPTTYPNERREILQKKLSLCLYECITDESILYNYNIQIKDIDLYSSEFIEWWMGRSGLKQMKVSLFNNLWRNTPNIIKSELSKLIGSGAYAKQEIYRKNCVELSEILSIIVDDKYCHDTDQVISYIN